jgi:hypothetical protein
MDLGVGGGFFAPDTLIGCRVSHCRDNKSTQLNKINVVVLVLDNIAHELRLSCLGDVSPKNRLPNDFGRIFSPVGDSLVNFIDGSFGKIAFLRTHSVNNQYGYFIRHFATSLAAMCF